MKDRLARMWEIQRKFNDNFWRKKLTLKEKEEKTKEFILYLQSEAIEFLNETNFKSHRRSDKIVRRDRLLEEFIDLQKYLICLAQIWDITPEENFKEFERKSLVVSQRFHQEKMLKLIDSDKIVGVDFDDVICAWFEGFVAFVSKKMRRNFEVNNIEELIDKLGEKKYKELKHEFRITGKKLTLKPIENASLVLKKLKALGYDIIILSARPYRQYPRLFADSIQWLKKHDMKYDAIFFDDHKEEKIIADFPHMKFFVEDNIRNANLIASKGYKVFLLNKCYNVTEYTHKNVIRIDNLKNILDNIVTKK